MHSRHYETCCILLLLHITSLCTSLSPFTPGALFCLTFLFKVFSMSRLCTSFGSAAGRHSWDVLLWSFTLLTFFLSFLVFLLFFRSNCGLDQWKLKILTFSKLSEMIFSLWTFFYKQNVINDNLRVKYKLFQTVMTSSRQHLTMLDPFLLHPFDLLLQINQVVCQQAGLRNYEGNFTQ